MHFILAILFIFVYVALLHGGEIARRHFILFFSIVNEIVIYYTLTFIDDTKCEIYMR